MDIDLLVKICARAWGLTVLALFAQGVPGRQAVLLAESGASRGALAQALQHLIALGLVERNPGHGHPLRPEFRLTDEGARIAPLAQKVLRVAPGPEQSVLRRQWTVPILSVTAAPRHFGEIRSDLGRVTDRALSQSLGLLEEHRWLRRDPGGQSRPPRPLYHAVNAGAEVAQALAEALPSAP